MTALLAISGVAKKLGSTQALRDANLSVEPGEIVAILGPSGSGKSTLLHCAAGILAPDSGTVNYRGNDLAAMSDRDRSALRCKEFGFIFQYGQLVPELTCLENAILGLRLSGVSRRTAVAAGRSWLDRLEVGEVASRRAGEVSGGQSQRVAIARALIGDPAVLFADEPTGALDSLQGERVMTLLTRASRETKTAVVLITHDARTAAYSDREVAVRDGRTSESTMAA